MSRLSILNGHDVIITLTCEAGTLLETDLASLYLINKYAGEDVFISVFIPERTDEEGLTLPSIEYDIIIKESQHGQG